MKLRKVGIRILQLLILLYALSFTSCKDGCWRCYYSNIFYTYKVCSDAEAYNIMANGGTCWK